MSGVSSRVTSRRLALLILVGVSGIVLLWLVALRWHAKGPSGVKVKYGITPYQDSALPVVPAKLGWYEKDGLSVQLVPLTWGDAISAISNGAVDVVIYNFNSFQPPYNNAAKGSLTPVFYCPLYVFKGQAIMVHADSGLTPFVDKEGESPEERERRIAQVARQLKGKRIAVTEGTELEQIVLAALQKAGLKRSDVTLINASPEDSLAAFLSGNVDAFAAGLTERVEARRHGGVELLVESDVMLPVIDGIVTSEPFAKAHQQALDKLIEIWFQNIRFMQDDLTTRSSYILDYLANTASTRYTPEEYKIAWTFDIFPTSAENARRLFSEESSAYYWKKSWDANNTFLLQERKITQAVPYSAYWGTQVLKHLSQNGRASEMRDSSKSPTR